MNNTIIFDLDDTLYDQLQPFEYAYYRHFGDSQIGVERLYRHFRIYGEALFEATQSGHMSISAMHVVRITRAVADFDIALPVDKARAFQKDYETAQQHLTLSDTMTTLLRYLVAQGVRMGIVTNGESDRQRAKIKALKLDSYFPESHLFISAELGVAKPNPAIFNRVGQQLEVQPHTTYFIGDHFENDVLGALNVGWQAIWFNRRHHIPSQMHRRPMYTVTTERELLNVVQHILASTLNR
ncbi:HAD family hydrolase [Staphylococcus lutrae]|uniref:Haloacid dehalogenase n=1 Tax=Staphylococcus lutrae TaxID=155085 RepID=A0AAC9RN84_9STAP|nr:HAD family hydrolase [Staphylococcus lutrae]ARJ50588.1 haloacid dehalogenase [Staphylococcus lutrae]PNZ37516.1 HAD family hydrolase [Staphylococcus lutrae]